MISKIKKRDGKIIKFKAVKIYNAINKAFKATKTPNKPVKQLTDNVIKILNKKFKKTIPTVEDIQDTVEEVLLNNNYLNVLRSYVIYREKHHKLRQEKGYKEIKQEPILTVNALKVLQKRYLLKDEKGHIIETPRQMFYRVAKAIAFIDKKYKQNYKKTEKEFYKALINLEFLPNSPTLFNAGTNTNLSLSACFVLPIEDSLKSISNTIKNTALIEKAGGGVGFSFSKLRPKGGIVGTTHGTASGPLSFMRIFDITTEVIKSGGRRRGAMMGILNIDHPDILDFIKAKQKKNFLTNFNLSVAVTNRFMNAVKKNKNFSLINPHTKKITKTLNAKKLFNLITKNTWKTGDPGLIFIDEINRKNQIPEIKIEATNPCGEQPLLPYESCNLGSINLTKMIKNKKIDWKKLRKTIRLSIHFLDNVIDANKFPLAEIEKITLANRRIGLGVMGFAEMLIKLKIRYDSNQALKIAEKLMKFIQKEAFKMSIELGKKRGNFPNLKKSIWSKKYKHLRNAALTTIAPTGTISIISNTSSGIEPLFAVSFVREVLEGAKLIEVNPEFEKIAKSEKIYTEKLIQEISKVGTIQKFKNIPKEIKKLFVTALDIKPEWHVKMQAAFQKYTDNAVSKTVNLPSNATKEDVKKIFLLAYKLKCKGITVYRYGSKKQQVLYIKPYIKAHSEYSGGCPTSCAF
jgi:ribonucleoside-diphosphate reductase alpha chain